MCKNTGETATCDQIENDASASARDTGLPGAHNGPQDAYRHCLGSCESARENGEFVTFCLGYANEGSNKEQERGEREMDLLNNAIGIEHGKSAGSFEQCEIRCMNSLKSGGLRPRYIPGTTEPEY